MRVSLIFFSILMLMGCASVKVDRVDVNQRIDLSGEWNDYDAKLVAEEMIQDCLDKKWIERYHDKNGRMPVVIVGYVDNNSHEHINASIFIKHLERELLNSERVVFVAASDERIQVREERADQQKGNTDPATIKQMGRERGADYMLIGSLNSIQDTVKNKSISFYQVNLELINLETNEKAWIGQKEIKKSIERRRYSL